MRLASFAVLLCLMVPVAAHADTLNFVLTPVPSGGGTYTLSFSLPQNPVTTQNPGDGFFSQDTYVTGGGLDGPTTILFINTNILNGDGDIQFILDADNSNQLFFAGDLLFSGDESAPTLLTGDFSLVGGIDGDDYTLDVQNAAVVAPIPEPSSWILLGTGALASFVGLRRRFCWNGRTGVDFSDDQLML